MMRVSPKLLLYFRPPSQIGTSKLLGPVEVRISWDQLVFSVVYFGRGTESPNRKERHERSGTDWLGDLELRGEIFAQGELRAD